jgi:hypothetical protein
MEIFKIQDWDDATLYSFTEDTFFHSDIGEFPVWEREHYGVRQILTIIEGGAICGVFLDLLLKPQNQTLSLVYQGSIIGRIPSAVVRQYRLLASNIISVQPILYYKNLSYIEITMNA